MRRRGDLDGSAFGAHVGVLRRLFAPDAQQQRRLLASQHTCDITMRQMPFPLAHSTAIPIRRRFLSLHHLWLKPDADNEIRRTAA
jgi:hypothetical protein